MTGLPHDYGKDYIHGVSVGNGGSFGTGGSIRNNGVGGGIGSNGVAGGGSIGSNYNQSAPNGPTLNINSNPNNTYNSNGLRSQDRYPSSRMGRDDQRRMNNSNFGEKCVIRCESEEREIELRYRNDMNRIKELERLEEEEERIRLAKAAEQEAKAKAQQIQQRRRADLEEQRRLNKYDRMHCRNKTGQENYRRDVVNSNCNYNNYDFNDNDYDEYFAPSRRSYNNINNNNGNNRNGGRRGVYPQNGLVQQQQQQQVPQQYQPHNGNNINDRNNGNNGNYNNNNNNNGGRGNGSQQQRQGNGHPQQQQQYYFNFDNNNNNNGNDNDNIVGRDRFANHHNGGLYNNDLPPIPKKRVGNDNDNGCNVSIHEQRNKYLNNLVSNCNNNNFNNEAHRRICPCSRDIRNRCICDGRERN